MHRRYMSISRPAKHVPRKKMASEQGTAGERKTCACTVAHESNTCAFILGREFEEYFSTHHIVFKIRDGVEEPRNADGRLAWTTRRTKVDRKNCRIVMTYKTKDNATREEAIPVTSLEMAEPLLNDEVIVIKGEEWGRVMYPTQWHREQGR